MTSQWFGSSDIDAFLNNLECKGTELNLFACKHPGITQVGNCYKTENIASLICGTPGRFSCLCMYIYICNNNYALDDYCYTLYIYS